MKANVPIQETEDLVGKVKEKKMARLFENMDKIDIQEQRRKTEEERKRAEEAEQMVEKHWKKGLS